MGFFWVLFFFIVYFSIVLYSCCVLLFGMVNVGGSDFLRFFRTMMSHSRNQCMIILPKQVVDRLDLRKGEELEIFLRKTGRVRFQMVPEGVGKELVKFGEHPSKEDLHFSLLSTLDRRGSVVGRVGDVPPEGFVLEDDLVRFRWAERDRKKLEKKKEKAELENEEGLGGSV